MNFQEKSGRRLNSCITKRLIELQSKGYNYDFMAIEQALLCIQNNHSFPSHTVQITLIDSAYDQLSNSFKYIHSVDTDNGQNGVMIAESIFTN